MKADRNIVYDGQNYKIGDEIWDLGSFECCDVDGSKRHYLGLSADAPAKLPKYDNLGTGSSARCLDTGDYYEYHAPSKKWYQQQGGIKHGNERRYCPYTGKKLC